MRPKVNIIAYANQKKNVFVLETVYREHPVCKGEADYDTFQTMDALQDALQDAVAQAKEMTYDYTVDIIFAGGEN